MNSFTIRLKSARKMSGMSLADLSKAIGNKVTRQALHKYEQGKVIPDSKMVIMLSNALNVRPDYFYRTTEVKIEFSEIKWFCKSKY